MANNPFLNSGGYVATLIEQDTNYEFSGDLTFSGDNTYTGDQTITGDITLVGDIAQTGDLVLTGDFSGTGDITRTGAFDLTGDATIDATAQGLEITGALTSATAGRGLSSVVSIANPNLGDGYGGAVEMDLTISGTSAGHSAASSSWVNMLTGTHASVYICAQNNGIYEDSACTLTSARLIFGMRAQMIVDATDLAAASRACPFSVNTNNMSISAVIDCNNLTDLGLVTDAGSDDGTLIPLMIDNAGTKKYVKIYSLA